MASTLTIAVTNLHFFAHHGLYEEELLTGNEFVVNVYVSYEPAVNLITHLRDTINYAELYALIREEMQKNRKLLETLAMELAELIHQRFPAVLKADIEITKLKAPINQFTGNVGVRYVREFLA